MLHLQARQIIKSDSKKPQHWNVAVRADNERKRTLTAKMRRSPAILSVYMPIDHATASSSVTPGPRGPGVVSFNVNAGHFLTTATRVTSPTWGPPPPCKQALTLLKKWSKVFFSFSMYYLLIVSWLPLCVKLAQLLCKCQQMTKMNNHVPKERLATSRLNYVLSKATHMTLP